ncbi:predicted protein [Postia placenta Mad-698-R]|nr:predicted protein [Postia placenta Mad-698-R]
MNGLYILIPDTSHMFAAEHPPREMSTPALSDDTGSCSSRESSPPATPVFGLSRAPSISFDDYCQHIPTGDGTDIGIVEPDVDYSLPEDISRLLKRGRLADTRTDEVRAERPLPPDIWSDATRTDDDAFFGLGHIPNSDCTSVGDVEPDAVDPSLEYVSRPFKRKRCADTSTYDVRVKRARTSGTTNDATKAEDRALAKNTSSYRSLGWHDLSANLHLMTVRVGREFIKRPLHYQHLLPIDALVHIPIIKLVHPEAVEPASLHIEQESPVEDIPRPPKRKRCPDTEPDELPAKRMRTSGTASEASKDRIPFGPHPRCMITGCVSADVEALSTHDCSFGFVADKVNRKIDYLTFSMRTDYDTFLCHEPENIIFLRRDLRELWETNRLLMIPHPQHLEHFEYCTVYKYYVIAEDEHPPDSCATMGHPITPPMLTAPCSYRSLGWHELDADLYSMAFRAGRKLSKRPLHYQHILRELLPHKEVNHTYSIIFQYVEWTDPLSLQMLPNRRLWTTGELSPCPDGYYRRPLTEYCSPLSDDDTARFPRRFRPVVSGIKRKRSGDTRVDSEPCTMKEYAQQVASVRPLAEPEDPELLIYRQEEAKDMVPAVEELWSDQDYLSRCKCN